MKKNIKQLIASIFIGILLISFCMPRTYAMGEIFTDGKDFLSAGNNINDTINTTKLSETSTYIYNALLGFAVMVAIIVAMVLGIQFMAASADEKAKVKEALIPFVVGCIVVFGSFLIWKIIVIVGNRAENAIAITQTDDSFSKYDVVESFIKNA